MFWGQLVGFFRLTGLTSGLSLGVVISFDFGVGHPESLPKATWRRSEVVPCASLEYRTHRMRLFLFVQWASSEP